MLGLNNKLFAYVSEGASDSNTYIEFVHQAYNSYDINGDQFSIQGAALLQIELLFMGNVLFWFWNQI